MRTLLPIWREHACASVPLLKWDISVFRGYMGAKKDFTHHPRDTDLVKGATRQEDITGANFCTSNDSFSGIVKHDTVTLPDTETASVFTPKKFKATYFFDQLIDKQIIDTDVTCLEFVKARNKKIRTPIKEPINLDDAFLDRDASDEEDTIVAREIQVGDEKPKYKRTGFSTFRAKLGVAVSSNSTLTKAQKITLFVGCVDTPGLLQDFRFDVSVARKLYEKTFLGKDIEEQIGKQELPEPPRRSPTESAIKRVASDDSNDHDMSALSSNESIPGEGTGSVSTGEYSFGSDVEINSRTSEKTMEAFLGLNEVTQGDVKRVLEMNKRRLANPQKKRSGKTRIRLKMPPQEGGLAIPTNETEKRLIEDGMHDDHTPTDVENGNSSDKADDPESKKRATPSEEKGQVAQKKQKMSGNSPPRTTRRTAAKK